MPEDARMRNRDLVKYSESAKSALRQVGRTFGSPVATSMTSLVHRQSNDDPVFVTTALSRPQSYLLFPPLTPSSSTLFFLTLLLYHLPPHALLYLSFSPPHLTFLRLTALPTSPSRTISSNLFLTSFLPASYSEILFSSLSFSLSLPLTYTSNLHFAVYFQCRFHCPRPGRSNTEVSATGGNLDRDRCSDFLRYAASSMTTSVSFPASLLFYALIACALGVGRVNVSVSSDSPVTTVASRRPEGQFSDQLFPENGKVSSDRPPSEEKIPPENDRIVSDHSHPDKSANNQHLVENQPSDNHSHLTSSEKVASEPTVNQKHPKNGENPGDRQGKNLLQWLGIEEPPDADPYLARANQLCLEGDLYECFKHRVLSTFDEFLLQDKYNLTENVRLVRMPKDELRRLAGEPYEFSTEPRAEEPEWDQFVKFLMRKVERFVKSAAFEVQVPDDVTVQGRYAPRFIDEIYSEIDTLEDKNASPFSRDKFKKLFIPMLIILKLFKLKLLLFLPLILGLASFKKVLGFIALVVPGVIGFFKLCKPDLHHNYGSYGHSSFYHSPPHKYNLGGFALPDRRVQADRIHSYQMLDNSGQVSFKESPTETDLPYHGYYQQQPN
ncbi:hypothetical protein LSTR_LSTR014161 [Laodelphax striatellus]|uniref:Osiris 2 n=1 Tax=Laodelphax striatellus TaxID=195883 RepID=A0A482X2H9_LAOST|nr:hypothetical protein LSTR_LSTR014161 [Laodelphax striatellus]